MRDSVDEETYARATTFLFGPPDEAGKECAISQRRFLLPAHVVFVLVLVLVLVPI
jgi:hypothetical protein